LFFLFIFLLFLYFFCFFFSCQLKAVDTRLITPYTSYLLRGYQ